MYSIPFRRRNVKNGRGHPVGFRHIFSAVMRVFPLPARPAPLSGRPAAVSGCFAGSFGHARLFALPFFTFSPGRSERIADTSRMVRTHSGALRFFRVFSKNALFRKSRKSNGHPAADRRSGIAAGRIGTQRPVLTYMSYYDRIDRSACGPEPCGTPPPHAGDTPRRRNYQCRFSTRSPRS